MYASCEQESKMSKRSDHQEKPLRVLTWHVHGSYLYYLTQTPCHFFLPVKPGKPEGYGGRSGSFSWGDHIREIPAGRVKDMEFDCILFQSGKNYLQDQFEILTAAQRKLPRIYLEHDPPRKVPVDTSHIVDDPDMLLVHVTHFNKLMWNNNRTPSKVIEHGVMIPEGVAYSGTYEKGIVVINHITRRGRRLGLDIFREVRKHVPVDLVGAGSEAEGGLGEIPASELPGFMARYRFFFNPIRYTSLGLAVCEAMLTGLPVIGLATTEMAVKIKNGISGYVHTDPDFLIGKMKLLITHAEKARQMGKNARKSAWKNFNIDRFSMDWMSTFRQVIEQAKRRKEPTENRYEKEDSIY